MLHYILFFIFAAVCLGGALNLVLQKHPINSALSLILVMVSLACLYLLLGAEFVAAVQIIVYAGAIMVLFVFVIMLLNAGEEEHVGTSKVAYIVGIPGVLLVLGMLTCAISSYGLRLETVKLGGFPVSTQDIGMALFSKFMLPFEVTSVLILVAIMGAVVLARREQH
jgi:NADH-quinone oxidoreductase subunit J